MNEKCTRTESGSGPPAIIGSARRLRLRLFVLLSLLLAASTFTLVWLDYRNERAGLLSHLQQQGDTAHALLKSRLQASALNTQLIATYIADQPRVQQLFLQGVQAVEREGGGKGGPAAAALRARLLQLLRPPMDALHWQYGLQQLNFNFGANATTFLRVYDPAEFGDALALRSPGSGLAAAIANRSGIHGLEADGHFIGLVGSAPIFARDSTTRAPDFIGVVEAGMSLDYAFALLPQTDGTEYAALLSTDHLRRVLDPAQLRKFTASRSVFDHYVIEATIGDMVTPMLKRPGIRSLLSEGGTRLVDLQGKRIAITAFALHGVTGRKIGTALAWRDVTPLVASLERGVRHTLLFAVSTLVVTELLLFAGLRSITRRFENVIVRQANRLEAQATHDALTGLYNRRLLDARLPQELAHAQRGHRPLSVMLIDFDHFKRINDTYGHARGDTVLRAAAALIQQHARVGDLAFRYGGEEFLLLLRDATMPEALRLAERLRQTIASTSIAGLAPGEVTVSIGLNQCQCRPDDQIEAMLLRADEALYRAKNEGRNRVVCAPPETAPPPLQEST